MNLCDWSSDVCSSDLYRPISLLPTLSKILEKIAYVQLTNFLDKNNLIYKHQYGFQRNKSTEHNLVHVINFISNAFNDNKYTIGVFFDLKKAFDVCSHEILLLKLKKIGISGTTYEWFRTYLSNRTQKTYINNNFSSDKPIPISVLQGSILGPILFLININDLHSVTSLFISMFADDTFTAASDHDLPSLISHVNMEINKIAIWFRSNKMAVNTSKTKFIIFHPKGKKINIPINIIFNENEHDENNPLLITPLERIHNSHTNPNLRAYKLLGIYLDENLTFNFHTNYLLSKLNRSLFCINRAKNFLTFHALKSLYFALIHSHLSYCPIILSCASPSNISKIHKLQKKAIRTITKSSYNAHTGPLFRLNGILPYDKILQQAKLHFMHSIVHNYAPASFSDTWITNSQRDPHYNLRNKDDYVIPYPRIDMFKRFTPYSLPSLWNATDDIKLQPNKHTFRYSVKTQLLSEIDD